MTCEATRKLMAGWARMASLAVLVVAIASGCSDGTPQRTQVAKDDWLNEFGPFDRVEMFQGHEIGIREDLRTVFAVDCQVANDATSSRGKYGDGPRAPGPNSQDYVHGYKMACRDGALEADLMP